MLPLPPERQSLLVQVERGRLRERDRGNSRAHYQHHLTSLPGVVPGTESPSVRWLPFL